MARSVRGVVPASRWGVGVSDSRRSVSFGDDDQTDARGEGVEFFVGEVGDLLVGHGGEDLVDGLVGAGGEVRHALSQHYFRGRVNTICWRLP